MVKITRNEVENLLDKVKLYRAYYFNQLSSDDFLKMTNEWYLQLEEYDLEDVEDKLNEFLKDEMNNNKIPNPYMLKSGLYKTKQKFQKGKVYTRCMYCGKTLEHGDKLNKHEDRCRSIKYLKSIYPRYFNRTIDDETTEDLKKMSDYNFKKNYYLILEKVYERMEEGEKKELLRKVLESRG